MLTSGVTLYDHRMYKYLQSAEYHKLRSNPFTGNVAAGNAWVAHRCKLDPCAVDVRDIWKRTNHKVSRARAAGKVVYSDMQLTPSEVLAWELFDGAFAFKDVQAWETDMLTRADDDRDRLQQPTDKQICDMVDAFRATSRNRNPIRFKNACAALGLSTESVPRDPRPVSDAIAFAQHRLSLDVRVVADDRPLFWELHEYLVVQGASVPNMRTKSVHGEYAFKDSIFFQRAQHRLLFHNVPVLSDSGTKEESEESDGTFCVDRKALQPCLPRADTAVRRTHDFISQYESDENEDEWSCTDSTQSSDGEEEEEEADEDDDGDVVFEEPVVDESMVLDSSSPKRYKTARVDGRVQSIDREERVFVRNGGPSTEEIAENFHKMQCDLAGHG